MSIEALGRAAGGGEDLPYGALQSVQLEEFANALPGFLDACTWPRERLLHEREARLRKLLAAAKSRSPWHGRRLAGLDVEAFVEADLPSLPTMTKADVMANFDEIVTDPNVRLSHVERHLNDLTTDAYLLGTNHAITSGGSTGRKGVFVFGWNDWIEFGLSSARPIAHMLRTAPQGTGLHAVALLGSGAQHGSSAFAQSFAPWIVGQFRKFTPLPMDMPIDNLIEVLNRQQPSCLSGYPSFLNELARAALEGRLRIRPQAVLVGGETLYPEHKFAIESAFDAVVYNFYGCSEASCLAFSCAQGPGLHVCDDTAILEPIGRNGVPVAPGVSSAKVLVTNLSNTLLPLIRYELDDTVTLADPSVSCACGSSFQKIETIDGRADDTFVYEGGVFVHPFALDDALDSDPGVLQYQLHQTARGVRVLVRARGGCDLRRIAGSIEGALRARGLGNPEVSVAIVEQVERGPVGKLRRFVPLRADGDGRRARKVG